MLAKTIRHPLCVISFLNVKNMADQIYWHMQQLPFDAFGEEYSDFTIISLGPWLWSDFLFYSLFLKTVKGDLRLSFINLL